MERAQRSPIFRPPETCESMEFLCRSWSLSAREISKTLTPQLSHLPIKNSHRDGGGGSGADTIHEENSAEFEESAAVASAAAGNPFSFASSETSLLVMERIMSQPQDLSPRISGRLSHSSGPLNGGRSCGSLTDSPPVSPSEIDDPKSFRPTSTPAINPYKGSVYGAVAVNGGGKTVGRWLKDRKEKKKEEVRAHNAQLHAAVSVAGVASAIAAIAAATAASSGSRKDEQTGRTDMAVASATTLVAAQCVEAAEAMGAERVHLAAVVSSAVNVRTAGDIMTLTAAAATALRGVATLKARTSKDVWTIASVIPVEKGTAGGGANGHGNGGSNGSSNSSFSGELAAPEENFLGICSRELLARGCELLKKTRNGDLHWKIVSVYINKLGQVVLKMKSKHVAGTVTKKKKNVVLEVVKDIPAWPGRHLLEVGDELRYFALKTVARGVVEFECRNKREYDVWTQGVSRLLAVAADRNSRHNLSDVSFFPT